MFLQFLFGLAAIGVANTLPAVLRIPKRTVDATFHLSHDLTVTSFSIVVEEEHSPPVPAWVKRTLGDKAVFFNKTFTGENLHSRESVSDKELIQARVEVRQRVSVSLQPPLCYIEAVGFINIDRGIDPFDRTYRSKLAIVGNSTFSIPLSSSPAETMSVDCNHRAMFENWRPESFSLKPMFWTLLIYCPVFVPSQCQQLITISSPTVETSHVLNFTAQALHQSISTSFKAIFHPKDTLTALSSTISSDPMRTFVNKANLGICVAIPYTSVDSEKIRANGLMLAEWIRYYVQLGIKVFIYDRDGGHADYLASSVEGTVMDSALVFYYNFTIRGLMDPSTRGLQYDNNELHEAAYTQTVNGIGRSKRQELQGHDKVQTLTHCRFEAKKTHGIHNMIVADFDEFIYCPKAALNTRAQGEYLQAEMAKFSDKHIDQVTYPQLVIANATASVRDCVVHHAHQGGKGEIFKCFGSYKHEVVSPNVKSFHLGHSCPITGYHIACGRPDYPRAFDCMCVQAHHSTSIAQRDCVFLHFSTNKNVHNNGIKLSETQIQDLKLHPNEIYQMMYS